VLCELPVGAGIAGGCGEAVLVTAEGDRLGVGDVFGAAVDGVELLVGLAAGETAGELPGAYGSDLFFGLAEVMRTSWFLATVPVALSICTIMFEPVIS
jgi:hypothetical protein